jgi:hypothetical protein
MSQQPSQSSPAAEPARAGTRRHLPTSPFQVPVDPPPPQRFELQDRVTHDKFGLGRVIRVEHDIAVLVDFGGRQVRIASPFPKLFKL